MKLRSAGEEEGRETWLLFRWEPPRSKQTSPRSLTPFSSLQSRSAWTASCFLASRCQSADTPGSDHSLERANARVD